MYLLIEPTGYPIAGNLAHWPHSFDTYGNWIEFEIEAREERGLVSHPVRATGVHASGRAGGCSSAPIFSNAASWRLGCARRCSGARDRACCSRRSSDSPTAVASAAGCVRLQARASRSWPAICRGACRWRSRTTSSMSWAAAVNRMLETIELQTDMLRTTFDSAAHDLRGPLYRARVRIEESLQHEGLSEDARGTMEATLAELERVQRTLGTLLQIAQAEGRGRDVPTEASGSRCACARTGGALSAGSGDARHHARISRFADAASNSRQQPAARAGAREPDRERHQICVPGWAHRRERH